jgi:AraC family transcriptional regulator
MSIPKQIMQMAGTGKVKTKVTKPQVVAYMVLRGSHARIGEGIRRLQEWVRANGHRMVGAPMAIFYTNPRETKESQLIAEIQWAVKPVRTGRKRAAAK